MIDIDDLRSYYECEAVVITVHAQERLRQRGICLIFGYATNDKVLHVVASDEGSESRIITAYFPDNIKFEDDLKTRRERKNEMYGL